LLSRSHRAVPLCRGAVAPSIAMKDPSRRPLLSRILRPCRWAALTLARVVTDIRHSSRPSQVSRLIGCCVASPIAALPFVPLIWLIVVTPGRTHATYHVRGQSRLTPWLRRKTKIIYSQTGFLDLVWMYVRYCRISSTWIHSLHVGWRNHFFLKNY